MGSVGQAMKKLIFSLILISSFSSMKAEFKIEELKPVELKAEDLKRQILQNLPTLYGWCSQEKAAHFFDLVLEVKPKVCVEIGVFAGSSVFPVASALKFLGEGIIIGIDSWDNLESIRYFNTVSDGPHVLWWSRADLNYFYNAYVNMLAKYTLEKYCVTIRSTSANAASQIDTIDILYIDGNPGEEAFTQDVLLYLPKVRSGGYIWVNDCLAVNKQQGLDHLMDYCDGIKAIENGTCVLLKKR